MRDNFWPALVRQYGEIAGPYVIQTDGCASINGGVRRFNEHMGYEALRIIFRGQDENDPRVRQRGCGGWGVSSSSTHKESSSERACWQCIDIRTTLPRMVVFLIASSTP